METLFILQVGMFFYRKVEVQITFSIHGIPSQFLANVAKQFADKALELVIEVCILADVGDGTQALCHIIPDRVVGFIFKGL